MENFSTTHYSDDDAQRKNNLLELSRRKEWQFYEGNEGVEKDS